MADLTGGDEKIFPRRQRRRRQLDTPDDVRRTLARVVRALERGKLAPPVATAMIAGLKALLAAFEQQDTDARLAQLEELMADALGKSSEKPRQTQPAPR